MYTIRQFRTDSGGNVAMMFSVACTFILIAIGASLDHFGMSKMQGDLQSQLDSAALAGATASFEGEELNKNDEEAKRREIALKVMRANGFEQSDEMVTTKQKANSFMVSATETYKPFFGKLLGGNREVGALSESGLSAMQGMEIALVLDNTYSMQMDGKLTALKVGANGLVDAIERSKSDTRVAVVPFSRYVRIPDTMRDADWLDVPESVITTRAYQQATHTGGTCSEVQDTRMRDGYQESYTRTECTNQITTYEDATRTYDGKFVGCVGTRMQPYAEQDTGYAAKKIPGLLEVYTKEETGLDQDKWTHCPKSIRPLSKNYDGIREMITALYPIDDTHLPTGLVWGQRVLSSGLPFDEAEENSQIQRVMVFMTDGKNTTEIRDDQTAREQYNAPPFIKSSPGDDQYSPTTNAATARLCTAIKDQGTIIYTISFKVEDPATQVLLRNCATEPRMAFTAESNEALIASFETISKNLESTVRLMR